MGTVAESTKDVLRQGLRTARKAALDRLTPTIVQAKLTAMAAALQLRPSLRHHLVDAHPSGTPFVFDATIEFVTVDGRAGVHAVFRDGRMRVAGGPARKADTTVRFRDTDTMRRFFEGNDSLGMLLDGGMELEGNLTALLKFGHMSTVVTRGGKRVEPRALAGAEGWPKRHEDLPAPAVGSPALVRPDGEVLHLDDPSLPDRSLDDFPRIKRLLWLARTTRPAMCTERARLLTDFAVRHRAGPDAHEAPVLRQARAVHAIL